MMRLLVSLVLAFSSLPLFAVTIVDDEGTELVFDQPALRVVSLAPHLTENLFSAGAGSQVVGVVSYSDFPEEAKAIASVGNYRAFSLEAILALDPDLIVAWKSGNGDAKIAQLKSLGLKVFVGEPREIEDIASSIARLGLATGHEQEARQAGEAFLATLAQLRREYSSEPEVGVFYQVWNAPLQTLNGEHLISDVIRMCGGRNVFSDALTLAPHVSVEGVVAADPEVIVVSGMGENRPEWLEDWRSWTDIRAVRNQQLYFINPNHLVRHSSRILLGAKKMCEYLKRAR